MTAEEKRKNVKDVFNITAAEYIAHFGDDWEFIDEINKSIGLLDKGSNVLDLGSGGGYITNYLLEQGLNSVGVDFSHKMIEIAKGKYPQCKFIEMNILDIENYFPEDYFDSAMAIYILYFIPREETKKFLVSLSRVLKDGAKVLFVTQSGNGETFVPESLLPESEDMPGLFVNLYNKEDLITILEGSGFSIEDFIYKENIDPDEIGGEGRFVLTAVNQKTLRRVPGGLI